MDHRGGGQTSLQLQIEAPKPLSLTASTTMQEILHSEPLTGLAVSLHLHTTLLFSHMQHKRDTDSLEDSLEATRRVVECSASPTAAVRSITVEHSTAQHGRCTFTLAAALPEALSEIVLHASIAGEPHLSAAAPVKVWQIETVAVTQQWQFDHPKGGSLRRVSGSMNCSETSDMCAAAVSCMNSSHTCADQIVLRTQKNLRHEPNCTNMHKLEDVPKR